MEWAASHAEGSRAWAVLKAESTGEKVTVTDETTADSITVANPDGTLTTHMTPGPERVWRGGKWRTVDATLVRSADGSVKAKEHPTGLRLAGEGGTAPASLAAARKAAPRDLVTLGSGGESVTLQWKGGLPEPQIDGTTARYPEAVPGADLVVEATRTGFEQFVEIQERPEGAYSYTLPVKAEGLKARANDDGSVTFTDAGTGAVRATMPAPVMWDSTVDRTSGEHTNRARVDMEVVDKGQGRVDLVVTPGADFLADPKTRYPVTVDPSTSALAATFDTYVQQGETVDWSNDVELDMGNPGTTNADGTPRTARSFITWNTTPIQDALITDTNLALWNFHSGNTDCSAQSWTVWDTTASSTSSRWTSQPTWKQQYHSSTQTRGNPDCTATQPDGWINADVDTLVQSWASAKVTRGHMGLRAATDDTKAWKRVNSGNSTANQPKLSVTYNYRPSDGANRQAGAPFKSYAGVWAVNTTTPTLRDTFTDADGDTVSATFQVYDAATNTPITTPAGEGLLVSDFGEQGKPVSVTVPTGQLKDGRTYKFRTNAYDGTHYNLNWSAWTQFVVDTTAPGAPASMSSATYPENWGGGGKDVPGVFDVVTGEADVRDVQWRLDPYDDDPVNQGWQTVPTTATGLRASAADTTASFSLAPTAVGNHTLQTRSVDRADNTGPIKDYGFTAGSRDYDRAQVVDIALPDRDTTATQPAPSDPPQPYPYEETQPQTTRAGDLSITMTPLKQRSARGTDRAARELSAGEMSARADSPPDPVVKQDWCKAEVGATQLSLITRTEACVYYRMELVWNSKLIPGVDPVTYSALFEVAWQSKTDPHGSEIKTWVQLQQVENTFPADERAVLFGDGHPEAMIDSFCFSTACDDGSKSSKNIDFYGDLSWDGGMDGSTPNDDHVATGSVTHTWNGDTNQATGETDRARSVELPVHLLISPKTDIDPPPFPDGTKREWEDKLPMPLSQFGSRVRCDKVASYGDPGCVQKLYVPTYRFNTANYPAAAAHAWLLQNKSGIAGMGQTRDDALEYIPPKGRNHLDYAPDITSRNAICSRYRGTRSTDTGWVPRKAFVPHRWTALHHTIPMVDDEVNCDEFPFASTYQSAGMKIPEGKNPAPNGGADCLQTVAARADDGSTHLLDDTRYDAPTFAEICGRSSMSGKVNQGSMSPFGDFARQLRLIDEDRYLLDPGNAWFRGCDTSQAKLVCTMSKP
ncbi:DNRLRE domain-containing protein [Streptomyces sp. NPDC002644]